MMERFEWTDGRVSAALEISPAEVSSTRFRGVTTDSRAAREGDLFVALRGDHFDGHDYVADALDRGALGAVVSRAVFGVGDTRLYPVDDTLVALGRLARHRRTHLDAAVVGITGSSGKTGTKDLTQAAIEGSRRLHATRGNLNNRIGLPLTLLDAPDDAEVVILEMGSNEPGEIRALTEIAAPGIGVVTTVSETHIEKLASLDGVLQEKLDLLRGLSGDGAAVVGDEPPVLPAEAARVKASVRVVGWSERADASLRPEDAEVDEQGRWSFRWRGEPVRLRTPGRHTVQNALLALTVAELLDVPAAHAAQGVSSVEPSAMRGEIRRLGRLTLVLDCYNANPQSTAAALDLLATMEPGREKVAILGTMLELGARGPELHGALLERAMELEIDLVVATGDFARVAANRAPGGSLLAVADPLLAYEALRERLDGNEVVLLKASRGVALERLIPRFEADFGEPGVDSDGTVEA